MPKQILMFYHGLGADSSACLVYALRLPFLRGREGRVEVTKNQIQEFGLELVVTWVIHAWVVLGVQKCPEPFIHSSSLDSSVVYVFCISHE